MAIVLNISDNKYIGTLKAGADVKPGYFVTPNFTSGDASVVTDGTGRAPVVCNVNTHIDEECISDKDFTVPKDEYLRLHYFKVGEKFTTDIFDGTYSALAADDVFVVASGGAIEKYSTGTYAMEFVVTEKLTLNGANALKLIVAKA